ncbi:hypothetical protein Nepgr_006152 [Nepenthes gracilis]|uniref:Uncharacterized protein n=1 Tax=Nepenthes gracilis TaxID=150966 RepID=A0AAD3S4K4_NEPGR|nr:hypothetical protein Nepgr_006152 [Nepenthes gracilis]
MAIELCPDDSSRGMSPRISFSHDFYQTVALPNESHKSSLLLDSPDFDFCVRRSFDDQYSSLADELFSNGVIVPTQIKKKHLPDKHTAKSNSLSSLLSSRPLQPQPSPPLAPSKDGNSSSLEAEDKQQQQRQNSKSFWGFKRSRSLNCGSLYSRGLCPLPLLSRSKSTGSISTAKRSWFSKDDHHRHANKHNSQKKSNLSPLKCSQSSSSSPSTSSSLSPQKPPLKKNYGSMGINGGIINPILNVPSANLSGLRSIFSVGKDKGKKK